MLRNVRSDIDGMTEAAFLLNEVLSLNAQECTASAPHSTAAPFLNEVLSLNAQELL